MPVRTQVQPWAERARTLLAVTRTASLQTGCRLMAPHTSTVQVVSRDDGHLTVRVPETSTAMAGLGACRVATLTVRDPHSAWSLRVVGSFRMERADGSGHRTYSLTPLSVRGVGSSESTIGVEEFLRAEPDPLTLHAESVLLHLESAHGAELMAAAREQGHDPLVVSARQLSSRGLELSVLGADGVGLVRLDFTGEPVRTVGEAVAGLPVDCSCWA